MKKFNRRPSRAQVLRSLRELEILWRPPEKDKPGARGGESTGPDTTEHCNPDSTPARPRKGTR